MAFTVEDGTGLEDSNSFTSVAYADAYFTDRGVTDWTGADSVKQTALIKATDYIETRFSNNFRGSQLTTEQALSFPRDLEGDLPACLQKATCEYALRSLSAPLAPDPTVDTSGLRLKGYSKKLGPLEKKYEYADAGAHLFQPYPMADSLLKSLLRPSRLIR